MRMNADIWIRCYFITRFRHMFAASGKPELVDDMARIQWKMARPQAGPNFLQLQWRYHYYGPHKKKTCVSFQLAMPFLARSTAIQPKFKIQFKHSVNSSHIKSVFLPFCWNQYYISIHYYLYFFVIVLKHWFFHFHCYIGWKQFIYFFRYLLRLEISLNMHISCWKEMWISRTKRREKNNLRNMNDGKWRTNDQAAMPLCAASQPAILHRYWGRGRSRDRDPNENSCAVRIYSEYLVENYC